MASATSSSSAKVVSCQCRVLASLELGKTSRSAIMAIDQVAPSRGLGGDEVVEAELADHLQDGLDVAVRERAGDAEGVGGGDEGLALEGAFDDLDEVIGEMGEVAEGLVGDGLSLADGPSEQMGDVGLSLVDPLGRGHMYGAGSCWHAAIFGGTPAMSREFSRFLVATFPGRNR